MKIGDKAKYTGYNSTYKDKVGIIMLIPNSNDSGRLWFPELKDYTYFNEDTIELVEIATYLSVPLFKVGEIVKAIVGEGKYMILAERDSAMVYLTFSYDDNCALNVGEDCLRGIVKDE